MKSSTNRVASRWMQAENTDEPSESVGDVSPGAFVDLMAFFQAVAAYRALKGDEDPQTRRAAPLVRRFQSDLVAGANRYFAPLTDDTAFAGLRNEVRTLTRGTRGLDHASEQAAALRKILWTLHPKPQVVREVFSDSRSYTAVMRLAALAATDSAGSLLNSVASLTPASRLQLTRKWIRDAAEAANVAPSKVETVLSDAENARHLGEDLHTVEVQLATADPVSQRAADLQVEKQAIIDQIEKVVADSPSPAVVLSAAASATTQPQDYATATAKRSRLSPDQERAMMARGKAIIAAGAGSGKTATLASKVAYHVNELGVPPGAVIATSFSRKSAAELRRRIAKYGADIPDSASTGFGTTHSVAGKLLREYGGGGRNGMKSYQQTDLVRLAMEQVQMVGPGVAPPPPTSLFDVSSDAPVGIKFRDAIQMAFDRRHKLDPWSKGFIESFYNPSDQWYARTMRATGNLTNPHGLSDKQREIVKKVFGRLGINYSPTTDPGLAPAQTQPAPRVAAKDKNKGLREKYKFFSQPANEWFNLGLELVEEDGQGNKKPIPTGFFKNAISKFKGRAVSPSEAWALSNGSPEAAVYAAYEWLKGSKGETDFQGLGDFDDVLLDVSKMLLSSPRVRQQVQSRFKVALVDEAQDLNRAQHLMFGLITGFVDPAKVPNIATAKKMGELAKDDGSMTADTYCFIGDDKQCVEANSLVETQNGPRRVGDLAPGDEVLAYRNGKVLLQAVRHVVPSSWTWGYKVTMESGQTLTMSPNHKLWATEPQTEDGQVAVYLMYRKDMGFRVGITNKGKVGSEEDYLNSYGGRVFLEKAERLWVLDICSSREEALLTETDLSLTYGIPTTVFNGEHRDLNQDRINTIFQKHGKNGGRLLEERNLSFDLPHWMSQSYTKHGRDRHTLQFLAHSTKGSQVAMEWVGDKFDKVLQDVSFNITGERRRLRRWFGNYREGLAHAEEVARRTGANLSYRMATPEGTLRETTASGLFVGMSIPVLDQENETIALDRVACIERVDGSFIDLDVLDASNFFANGILTSNSIYEFRAADPEAFIDMSELVAGGAGFKTEVLKTNYRSGQLIVEAANRLISYNTKQIPMTCAANPQRVDRGGIEAVNFAPVEGRDMSAPAEWLATSIAETMEEGRAGAKGYDAFGVGLRSNAEAYTYGIELLKKGIPFRSKANFFGDPTTKALLHWLTIADEGVGGSVDRVNEAVLGARKAPASKLGDKFEEILTQRATGNYLTWLQDNWTEVYGSRGDWAMLVRSFVDNLLAVAGMKGGASEQVLEAILDLTGHDGRSVRQVLVDRVSEDEEAIAELRAESPTGTVTDEEIESMAFAPIAPLKGLLGARADLSEAMKYVRQLQSANEKLAADDDPDNKKAREPAVTLGTMHSWKGLEVENMYIPFVGGRFPRFDADEEDLASERRLAYVAVTRGENRVVVMNIPTVRRTKQGAVTQTSQFVGELCIPPAVDSPFSAGDEDAEQEVLRLEERMNRTASYLSDEAISAYLSGQKGR